MISPSFQRPPHRAHQWFYIPDRRRSMLSPDTIDSTTVPPFPPLRAVTSLPRAHTASTSVLHLCHVDHGRRTRGPAQRRSRAPRDQPYGTLGRARCPVPSSAERFAFAGGQSGRGDLAERYKQIRDELIVEQRPNGEWLSTPACFSRSPTGARGCVLYSGPTAAAVTKNFADPLQPQLPPDIFDTTCPEAPSVPSEAPSFLDTTCAE